MTMDLRRLRNLTTGFLHTEIGHVYEDIEVMMQAPGIMTHQLPAAMRALRPWLREHVADERAWAPPGFDATCAGTVDVPEMSDEDRQAAFERFAAEPSPLAGKPTAVLVVDAGTEPES